MPREIYLVKVGMNMTEGVVEEWYVADGAAVTKGELLYRLETEKVNLDVDAEATGTVRHLVAEGVTLEPGDVVGYIYEAGEAIPDVLPAASGPSPMVEPAAPAAAQPATAGAPTGAAASARAPASPAARRLAVERGVSLDGIRGSGPGGRIVEADVLNAASAASEPGGPAAGQASGGSQRSSPMARKRARELDVTLDGIDGTGPGGRITLEDVESAAARPASREAVASPAAGERQRLSSMRRTIATRMQESLSRSAQLTMDMDVQMDDAVKLREQLVAEWQSRGLRPTYTDLVVRAVAKALPLHPTMNSELDDAELVLKREVHVGVAVALDEGLIVPVVRNADRLDMETLVATTARLAEAARNGGLSPDDVQGGTFTVSALGMFGVDSFTPIINMPQAGILGVNRIRDATRWTDRGPERARVMRLSLTWDHRVLDGAPAARFLGGVRDLLEAPYRLLV